ncbi:zinc-binding dehydrogenase [Methylophaga pinxianii]|uniref:zinc-binding dehydrogenase n=1 Tax=Methylophaga pinxianii TaxID=2881052 RepID=UPI001FF7EAE6|nr:zinc-binding dehydrogenase [Methylophaga pinxianii]UPH45018.1 zinc-binding dehydrogenase [Methylophaga pinxianii]
MLTQLAAKVANLKVITTASRPENDQWACSGAHHVIYPRADWREQLNKINVRLVDYITSLAVSEEHLAKSADILSPQGTFCLIAQPLTTQQKQHLGSLRKVDSYKQ